MNGGDETSEKLEARCFLYAFGQLLLGNEPTRQRLESIDVALLEDAFAAAGVSDEGGVAEAIGIALADEDAVMSEYTRLFVGPAKLAAAPWEAVYRTNSRELFQRETLDVRNSYRKQGFLPAEYPKVSDDHISLELGFLAALAQRALVVFAEGDRDEFGKVVDASSAFLDEHLLLWIGEYEADLRAAAPNSLYARVAAMLCAFARADRAFLAEAAASS